MMGEDDIKKIALHTETPQLLRKAEDLAKTVDNRRNSYDDADTRCSQQELLNILKKIIVTDLEYALDRKVEQLLWNSCFKNFINHLQTKTRDKKQSVKAGAQVSLSAVLENATGFYILLLEEIRFTFNLSVPFLQNGSPYGTIRHSEVGNVKEMPRKASTNYICQHCLVHLGDIARYRNNMQQAETFYRHATTLAPSSGQPYNQIAILEASRGNKLSTVYFYVRAVSLAYPFPAAFTNISKLFSKLAGIDDRGDIREMKDRTARVTQHTFIPLFLRVQGLLHHSSHLSQCVCFTTLLCQAVTTLVATAALSTWQLIQIITINIWVWDHLISPTGPVDAQDTITVVERIGCLSAEEQVCLAVIADMQAALLSAMLMPVYTVVKGQALLDYFALPAIRILLEWVLLVPGVLEAPGWRSRQLIWPGLAHLLNEIEKELKSDVDDCEVEDFQQFPLPEEYDLQSFKPLLSSFTKYNYKLVNKQGRQGPDISKDKLNILRLIRIQNCGLKLSEQKYNLVEKGPEGEWRAVKKDVQEDGKTSIMDVDKLLQQIQQQKDDVKGDVDENIDDDDIIQWDKQDADTSAKGILKIKLNSDKAEEAPSASKGSDSGVGHPRYRSSRQNVAMAAILNSAHLKEEKDDEKNENKRVMFRTPSPNKENLKTKTETKQVAKQTKPLQEVTKKPFPALDKASKEMNVKDLDLSKPPPSLHSNIRPPKLVNSPGIRNSSSFEAEPSDTSAIHVKQAATDTSIIQGISPISPTDPNLTPILNQFSSFGMHTNQNIDPDSVKNMDRVNPLYGLQNTGALQFSPSHQPAPRTVAAFQPPLQDFPLFQPSLHSADPTANLFQSGVNQNTTFSPPGGMIFGGNDFVEPGRQEEGSLGVMKPSAPLVNTTTHQEYSLFSGGSPWRAGFVSPLNSPTNTNSDTPKSS